MQDLFMHLYLGKEMPKPSSYVVPRRVKRMGASFILIDKDGNERSFLAGYILTAQKEKQLVIGLPAGGVYEGAKRWWKTDVFSIKRLCQYYHDMVKFTSDQTWMHHRHNQNTKTSYTIGMLADYMRARGFPEYEADDSIKRVGSMSNYTLIQADVEEVLKEYAPDQSFAYLFALAVEGEMLELWGTNGLGLEKLAHLVYRNPSRKWSFKLSSASKHYRLFKFEE